MRIRTDAPDIFSRAIPVTTESGCKVTSIKLACVEYGATLGITDYSRKERNEWGDLILVERSFSDKAGFRMLVPNSQRASIKKLLTKYRATPVLWIGVPGETDTYVYGIYNEFQFIIEFTEDSVLTLDLEGLT